MANIRQIAEKAGVSIGTVDRVIHNRKYVSHKARAEVEQAIHELGYTPNIFARQLKLDKTFCFGVLMPEFHHDSRYWQMPADGILKAQNELESHRIRIRFFHYDRYSRKSFLQACDEVLQTPLDGLLLAPVFSAAAEEFVQRLPENLPFVCFDSTVSNSRCLSSIIQDSFLSGLLAGRLMHLVTGGKGVTAAVRILPEDFHIDERVRGFQEYYAGFPGLELKTYDALCRGNQNLFFRLIQNIIDENENLKGIFISNALTFQVVRALNNTPSERRIHIIGYDVLKENIDYLKAGAIDFLITQRSELQGYQGIYMLFRRIVLSEPVPKRVMMPIEIIAKENVDYYIGEGLT